MLAPWSMAGLASSLHPFQFRGVQAVMNGFFELLIHIIVTGNARVRADIESSFYHRKFSPVFTGHQKTLAANQRSGSARKAENEYNDSLY